MALTKEIRRKLEVDIYLPLTKTFPEEICQRLIFAVLILDRINEETVAKISPSPKDHDGIFTSEVFEALRDVEPLYVSEITEVLGHIKPRDWGYVYEVLQGMGLSDKRKKQGAHFTPPQLVDEVVRPTLGQLFRQFWESSSNIEEYISQLRAMTVCDPAMGGGVFLLRAAQEIATEMAWAAKYGLPRLEMIKDWEEPLLCEDTYGDKPPEEIKWEPYLAGVIENSIYGVDIDPISCDLGRWALWFLQGASPEIKLSSNIKTGDALLGLFWEDVDEAFAKALSPQNNPLKREDYGIITSFMEERECGYSLEEKKPKWAYDLAFIIRYVGYTSGSGAARRRDIYKALLASDAPNKGSAKDSPAIEEAFQILFEDPTSDDALTYQQNLKDWIEAQEVLNVFHWELEFPHIFNKKDGFDAIVANPPFIGSQRLRAHLGPQLQSYLGDYYFDGSTPEYAAFFFARYTQILNDEAVFSSLAPNTIAQGRIRRAALLPLLQPPSLMKSFELIRTCNSRKWPGDASVYIALVTATRKSASSSNKRLVYVDWASDDTGETLHAEMLGEGKSISSFLDILPDYDLGVIHSTKTLSSLQYYDSQRPLVITGFNIQSGFKRSLSFAEKIPLEEQDCVFAYYNNSVVKNQPVPQAKELVIDFTDALRRAGLYQRPGSEQEAWLAKSYKFLFSSLSKTIENKTGEWWKLERDRLHLRDAWSGVDQVIVFGDVSKCWTPQIIDKFDKDTGLEIRPTIKLYVIPEASLAILGVITSAVFESHLRRMSATLETRLSANPSETFPTFPMPWDSTWSHEEKRPVLSTAPADIKGLIAPAIQNILRLREQLLASPPQYFLETNASDWGITKLYNNFDNPKVKGAEIDELRKAHRDLLDAVATAYGWTHIVGKEWSFDRPWLDGTYRYVPAESIRQQFPLLIEKENIRRQRQESCLICQQIVPLLPQKGLTMQEVLALPLVKSMPIPTSDSEVLKPILESGLEQGVVGYSYGRWVPL